MPTENQNLNRVYVCVACTERGSKSNSCRQIFVVSYDYELIQFLVRSCCCPFIHAWVVLPLPYQPIYTCFFVCFFCLLGELLLYLDMSTTNWAYIEPITLNRTECEIETWRQHWNVFDGNDIEHGLMCEFNGKCKNPQNQFILFL